MLRIQMIGLAIMAALAMSAVAASSASAAHLWLIGGKLVASEVKIHSLGLLLLTDHTAPLGAVQIHCHGFDAGTVGPHALDLVTSVTTTLLGTNDKITCTYDKQGGCESSPAPLALAVNLPWHTELYLVGTEVRDMIVSSGAGSPGWKVTCKTFLGTVTDECTVPLGSTGLVNEPTATMGVLAIFDANSQNADCKLGAGELRKEVGLVRGSVLLESPSAGPLLFD
jgi:hypothetical protein